MSETKPIQFGSPPNPFTDRQLATLQRLTDLMIPASPDARMPSASSLDLFADVSDMREQSVNTFSQALDALDAQAAQAHNCAFGALEDEAAQAVLAEVKGSHRRFVHEFSMQTAGRYLRHETVMPLIGLEPRPPWPQGNEVAQGDWSLLDKVKASAPIYRKPPE